MSGLALVCVLLVAFFSALPHVTSETESAPVAEFTLGALADEYADSMYPASEYGSKLVLYVGNSYDRVQNLSGPARIYIQFDLSAVPRGAHVVSADLALYQMYAPASSQTYEVHMVESAWNESTMDWKTKPKNNSAIVTATRVPTEKDVWVSWNVTSAVQTWVNGDAPNYGLMIRIQDERTGVANEASGFYSREYPKKDLQPKLRVLCRNQPPITFLISTRIVGLPAELTTRVASDSNQTITLHGGEVGYLLFESGKTHTITVDRYVYAANSTRYYAEVNSITASTDGEIKVTYEPQFLVTVKSEPSGLIEREWSEWYSRGARIETPPAREIADEGTDMKLVLDAWYINNVKQTSNPIEYVVAAPANLTARYTVMYNVNVSSPFGQASGSGWHAAGSSVEIAVEPTYLPAEGFLGYLGFGTSFDYWTGSVDSTSSKTTITVNGPIQARAVWREDRSRFLLGVAVVAGLALLLVALRARKKRRRPEDRLRKTETRNPSGLPRTHFAGETRLRSYAWLGFLFASDSGVLAAPGFNSNAYSTAVSSNFARSLSRE